MKQVLCAIFLLLLGLLLYIFFRKDPAISNEENSANHMLNFTANFLAKKYGLNPVAISIAMPGGAINNFTLCFDTKKPLNKEELRILLIECAQELVQQINANKKIQTALAIHPFTEKNIDIIIYNRDKFGREVYDPGISTADLSEGILIYKTVDQRDKYVFKHRFTETYEEAFKAVLLNSTVKK